MPSGARWEEDPEPRYEHWRRVDEWTLLEATCLLCDVEPDPNRSKLGRLIGEHWRCENMPAEKLQDAARVCGWPAGWAVTVLQEVRDARDAACVSVDLRFTRRPDDRGSWQVPAREFLIWARGKGYRPPRAFNRLLLGASTGAELEQKTETQADTSMPRKAKRHNALSSVIAKARSTSADDSTASVWMELRELALAEVQPFNGVDGAALLYTDTSNRARRFTQDALGKRLARMQPASAKHR
jgi:hypothetical protein